MSRLLLVALAALVVAIPATAAGSPATQLEGTVGAKLSRGLIRIDARKMSHILRVPGSQSRIHVGQRVELRGALLRQRGNHSRVLARNVALVRSVARNSSRSTHGASGSDDATLSIQRRRPRQLRSGQCRRRDGHEAEDATQQAFSPRTALSSGERACVTMEHGSPPSPATNAGRALRRECDGLSPSATRTSS